MGPGPAVCGVSGRGEVVSWLLVSNDFFAACADDRAIGLPRTKEPFAPASLDETAQERDKGARIAERAPVNGCLSVP